MKILNIAFALSIAGVVNLSAQTLTAQVNVPAPTAYAITTRDGNSQIWQRTTYEMGPDGKAVPHIHKYTELATGLNHLVAGQWVASDETITILPDGTAAATNGQHQAYFPADIYNGEIKVVTPDGKVLLSQPTALSYDDGSNTVLIAVLTNSIGQLVSSNQIVYPSAFMGVNADLRYTYTIAGFEQDVILHEQPPAPASLGLNPDTTRIQVMTEFFNPPAPVISTSLIRTAAGELENAQLTFGTMRMVQGKAFSMGTNSSSVPVNKQWMQMSGRQFLVEEAPTAALADDLENLPSPVKQTRVIPPLRMASGHLTLPAQHLAKTLHAPHNRPIQLAEAALPMHGLVLDYQTIDSVEGGSIFQGDMTYYISGNVVLYGTNIFEGGTVLKYAHGAQLSLDNTVPLSWLATAYRPIVLTAMDDNSVGETISGSTGSPSGNYASIALFLYENTNSTLSNFRIAYASWAICCISGGFNLYNGQIINCQVGIDNSSGNIKLRNMLFANVQAGFLGDSGPIDVQNTTFNSMTVMLSGSGTSGLSWTNCVMANVAETFGGGSEYLAGGNNGFYNATPFGAGSISNTFYPFQTVGGGSYYLTNGCTFHNAGTTNIDPSLLADLATSTTYPPIVYSNVTVSSAIILSPQAQRDNTGNPDLGYHYDPVDYFVDMFAVTNALLTINAGTVIAADNSVAGIWLTGSSSIISIGTPLTPNWFVHYSCVQEQSVAIGTNGSSGFYNGLFINTWSSSQTQNGVFRFTKFAIPAGSSSYYFYDSGNWNYQSLLVQDCELWNSQNELDGEASGAATSATFNNNLFSESDIAIETLSSTNYFLSFTNNLFLNASIGVYSSSNVCAFFNNDFDTCTLSVGNVRNPTTIANGYDAYINCNQQLNPTNAYDLVLTNALAYETSWFGSYYQPTNSPLIKKGSTTADQVGLYHFTTQTNQVPETNSVVDIGYHYVATDSNGNLLDTNGDGIPDYLEDANGNGIDDPGEEPWNLPVNNLVLWLRADADITNTISGISGWTDQSGHVNNAIQSNTNNQPLYVTNAINGYPVVRFNGTSSYLALPKFLNGTTGAEVLVVLKVATNPPAGNQTLWTLGSSPYVYYPNTGGQIVEGFGSSGAYNLGVPAQNLAQYHLYDVAGYNGGWAAWINGALQLQEPGNSYGYNSSGTYYLGYNNPYNGTYYFRGDVAEVLVFNRPLTADERETANSYLNGKYGLVPAVPAAPTNLVAQAVSTNQISLTWQETFNQGATQVAVERSTSSNGVYQVIAQLSEALSYVDTNLTAGTTYYYQVQAVNLTQWSAASAAAWATTLTNGVSVPLGNLLLWLKADTGLEQIGTNTAINFWADQSGHTNNATQASGGNQPQWVAGALNGYPVVRFNGTSSYLALPKFLNGTTGAEVLVVLKVATNPPAGNQTLWTLGSSPYVYYPNTGGQIVEGFGSSGAYNLGVPAQNLAQYHLYDVAGYNGGWAAWINGALQLQEPGNSYGYNSSGTYYLGYNNPYNGTYYFRGDVAEVLVFNRPLTADERETANSYLNGKYGLVPAVPAAPTNLVAQAVSTNQISLTWQETFNQGATQVAVERSTSSNGVYQVIAQLSEALSYVDTNLTAGTTYYYQVQAVNLTQWSAASAAAWATTLTNGVSVPLGNLLLWLKADTGLEQIGTNTAINFWADQSGHTNNATQASGGNQPQWVAGALNGYPVVRFNGTSSYLALPKFLNGTTGAEVLVVLKVATNPPAGNQTLWTLGSSPYVYYPNTGGQIVEGFGSSGAYNLGVPAQNLAQYHLYDVAGYNGGWAAWINGALQLQEPGNSYGYNSSGTYYLGYNNPYNGTYYFRGDVAEVLVFNRPLTADEQDVTGNYLMSKYNLFQYATNAVPPVAPTNVMSIGVAPYQLNLQWTLTSSNITSLHLERELGTNGNYEEISSGGISSYITNFLDITASSTNRYYYRVRAHNYFGDTYSTVISPPTVAITNWPATILQGTANVVKATAADVSGSVTNVEFWAGNTMFGTDTSSPYSASWTPTTQGGFPVSALATDSLGNSQFSASVTLTSYLDSNGDGIPDVFQVQSGDNPLNPWTPPTGGTSNMPPNIMLVIPANATLQP